MADVTESQSSKAGNMSLAATLDLISYWVVVAGIYLIVGVVFFLGAKEKLFAGKIVMPEGLAKGFSGTFLASFPGLNFTWGVLGVFEGLVFLAILLSFVTGEFLPSRRKGFMTLSLSLAMLVFSMLSLGQNLTSNFAGAATQWSYFAGAGVILIILSMLPPNRSTRWLCSRSE